jgi:hypothetical protein
VHRPSLFLMLLLPSGHTPAHTCKRERDSEADRVVMREKEQPQTSMHRSPRHTHMRPHTTTDAHCNHLSLSLSLFPLSVWEEGAQECVSACTCIYSKCHRVSCAKRCVISFSFSCNSEYGLRGGRAHTASMARCMLFSLCVPPPLSSSSMFSADVSQLVPSYLITPKFRPLD